MPQFDVRDPFVNCPISECKSSYFDAAEFKRKYYKNDLDSLMLFHLNVRSLRRNQDELLLFLQSIQVKFHVLVLTETWLTDPEEFPEIPGYKSFHSVRRKKRGGGVSVLVRCDLQAVLLPDFSSVTPSCEMCTVQLNVNNKKFLVSGVYRPPDASLVDFNHSFFNLIQNDLILNNFSLFMCDFNVNVASTNLPDGVVSFISEFNSLSFFQKVSLPTRIQGDSITLIDHIWMNALQSCQSGVFPIHINDHYPIFVCLPDIFHRRPQELTKIKFRRHNVQNIQNFVSGVAELVDRFPETSAGTVDEDCERLVNSLYSIYDTTCPIKQKTISQKRLNCP